MTIPSDNQLITLDQAFRCDVAYTGDTLNAWTTGKGRNTKGTALWGSSGLDNNIQHRILRTGEFFQGTSYINSNANYCPTYSQVLSYSNSKWQGNQLPKLNLSRDFNTSGKSRYGQVNVYFVTTDVRIRTWSLFEGEFQLMLWNGSTTSGNGTSDVKVKNNGATFGDLTNIESDNCIGDGCFQPISYNASNGNTLVMQIPWYWDTAIQNYPLQLQLILDASSSYDIASHFITTQCNNTFGVTKSLLTIKWSWGTTTTYLKLGNPVTITGNNQTVDLFVPLIWKS